MVNIDNCAFGVLKYDILLIESLMERNFDDVMLVVMLDM